MPMVIPTVFLKTSAFNRTIIAGWSYSREVLPLPVQWKTNATEDWEEQIVDFIKRFPIEEIWVRHARRPWVEYTIQQWARKTRRAMQIAAILVDRGDRVQELDLSQLVLHRSITKT